MSACPLLRRLSSFRRFSTTTVSASAQTEKRDPAVIKKEYEELFSYARENLAYKCGNLTDSPSRFGFFRRRRLEKQVNYNGTKHPIFLYAYRAFIDAMAQGDKATLKKMCEATLYQRLQANSEALTKYRGEYFLVAKDIQLKMKLLDTRVITGAVFIERSKNLQKDYYEVTENSADKVTYKKKHKSILGKELEIDFEQLLKDRRP